MYCPCCEKETEEEFRSWTSPVGNKWEICKFCLWRIELGCWTYCKHCCQLYKDIKQHCKTKIHQSNREENRPVALTPDDAIILKKFVRHLKTKAERELGVKMKPTNFDSEDHFD